jgi:hypothetical protein
MEFLGEVLLLARGPLALIAKDKGLMASSGPLGTVSNVDTAFITKTIIKAVLKT